MQAGRTEARRRLLPIPPTVRHNYKMKHMKAISLLVLLPILLTMSCRNRQSVQENPKNESDNVDIFGNWYYTEYTDSTIKEKKIFDYSWSLASFAYEVKIDRKNPNIVAFNGYHESLTSNIKKISKNTYQTTDDKDQYWTLRFVNNGKDTKLYIKEYVNPKFAQKADPKEYVLSRKKVNLKTEELYFAKHIITTKKVKCLK